MLKTQHFINLDVLSIINDTLIFVINTLLPDNTFFLSNVINNIYYLVLLIILSVSVINILLYHL